MIKQRSILISSALILVGAFFVSQLNISLLTAQTKKVYSTQTYSQARAKLKNEDVDSIYKLAREFYSKQPKNLQLLKLIAADLKQTLNVKDDSRIKTLLKIVKNKIKKLKKNNNGNSKTTPDESDDKKEEDNSGKGELLTLKQINLVRLFEITSADVNIKIKFKEKVLKTYIARMQKKQVAGWDEKDAAKRFMKKSSVEKLLEIREMFPSDLKLLSKIEIKTDPKAIKDFKSSVWTSVKNSCAQSACHGSKKGKGGFRLIRAGKDKTRVLYSNFMILRGYKLTGTFEGQNLVNTDVPANSLILTFGMKPSEEDDDKMYIHPKKIPVTFPSTKNGRYKKILKWIQNLNGPTKINYLFKWDAPNKMDIQTQGEALGI